MYEINLEIPGIDVSLDNKMRYQFSMHQMMAACRFATQLKQLECEHKQKEYGELFNEILQLAMAVTIMSVAALEAYYNELTFEGQVLIIHGINKNDAKCFVEKIERKPTLDKYSVVFKKMKDCNLEKNGCWWSQMKTLIAVRDKLIHFKPEWHDDEGSHMNLSTQLQAITAIKSSPFLTNEKHLFPIAWASHSYCVWVISTTTNFITEFHRQLNIPSDWDKFSKNFSN